VATTPFYGAATYFKCTVYFAIAGGCFDRPIYGYTKRQKNSFLGQCRGIWCLVFYHCYGCGRFLHLSLVASDHTLLWERLPMALSLMSLLSIMVGEFVANKLGRLTLYPALVIGAIAVLYWYHREIQETSDCRVWQSNWVLPTYKGSAPCSSSAKTSTLYFIISISIKPIAITLDAIYRLLK